MARTKAMTRGIRKRRYRRKGSKYKKGSLRALKTLRRKQYLICNPEVKTYRAFFGGPIYHHATNAGITFIDQYQKISHFSLGTNKLLWPIRGVSDQERIGDAINNVKIVLNWVLETRSDAPNDIYVMCVLFRTGSGNNMNHNNPGTLTGFFKWNTIDNQAINGVVQQENYTVVKQWRIRVNQDKENGASLSKRYTHVIRFKYPLQFTENSTTLKNLDKGEYYFAFIGYRPATVHGTQIGWINMSAAIYYTD